MSEPDIRYLVLTFQSWDALRVSTSPYLGQRASRSTTCPASASRPCSTRERRQRRSTLAP